MCPKILMGHSGTLALEFSLMLHSSSPSTLSSLERPIVPPCLNDGGNWKPVSILRITSCLNKVGQDSSGPQAWEPQHGYIAPSNISLEKPDTSVTV